MNQEPAQLPHARNVQYTLVRHRATCRPFLTFLLKSETRCCEKLVPLPGERAFQFVRRKVREVPPRESRENLLRPDRAAW